jgi:hypothetical protein
VNLERDPIDSDLLGFGVYSLTEFSVKDDLVTALSKISDVDCYVVCKVPSHQLAEIHCLEAHGFRFSEVQLHLRKTIKGLLRVPEQFDFVRASETDIPTLQACADEAFDDDRMRRDPRIEPSTALRRYRGYIDRAFHSPDQRVYKTILRATGEFVAFKSHRIDSPEAATLLLGAVSKRYRNSGAGLVNSSLELNRLYLDGVKSVQTRISAANSAIMNLELGSLGFVAAESTVVLAQYISKRHQSSFE